MTDLSECAIKIQIEDTMESSVDQRKTGRHSIGLNYREFQSCASDSDCEEEEEVLATAKVKRGRVEMEEGKRIENATKPR
jgi:hypothetical protein